MSFRQTVRNMLGRHPRLDGAFRKHIWSRIHFPEMEMLFLSSLPPGAIDVAIDVGAALGPYSWILNRKARLVFAFEPGEEHGRYLAANVKGTRVTLVRSAVGDCGNTVKMYTAGTDTDAFHTATISLNNPVSNQSGVMVRDVEQVMLDDFFAGKLDGRHLDVLKVDVEGYENQVLFGAQKLLNAHHPLMICEIEERHNPDYREVFVLLRGMGYACYICEGGQYRPFDGDNIGLKQSMAALEERLSGQYDPASNAYLNNFVFQHPLSRIKVVP